jgi:hypothetical protein
LDEGFTAGDEDHSRAAASQPRLHELVKFRQDLVDGGLIGPVLAWIVRLVPGVGGVTAIRADTNPLDQATVKVAAIQSDTEGPGT